MSCSHEDLHLLLMPMSRVIVIFDCLKLFSLKFFRRLFTDRSVLTVPKFRVKRIGFGQKFVVSSALRDLPGTEDEDFVAIDDGRQPMRDQDRRSARRRFVQGFHDAALSYGVEWGRCFVENLKFYFGQLVVWEPPRKENSIRPLWPFPLQKPNQSLGLFQLLFSNDWEA